MLVRAKTLLAPNESVAVALAATLRTAPLAVLPIPTNPAAPNIAEVFRVGTFALVVANTFVAESAFKVHVFPAILRVAPPPVVFTPIDWSHANE